VSPSSTEGHNPANAAIGNKNDVPEPFLRASTDVDEGISNPHDDSMSAHDHSNEHWIQQGHDASST